MIDVEAMKEYIENIYSDHPRGLIHGIEHSIRLVNDAVELGQPYQGDYDEEILQIAGLLHGAVHYCEDGIREWLRNQGLDATRIDHIIAVAWESQTKNIPASIEGKILHDAHFIEGGKEFHILKPFIVGSEMNQPLEKTIDFIRNSIKANPVYYLKESRELFEEIRCYESVFIENLEKQLCLK